MARWPLALGVGAVTPAVDPIPAAEAVPDALLARDQWLCWRTDHRDGKPTKLPVEPQTAAMASATDPATWTDFQTARDYATTDAATGVGFVFTADDPLVGVDLDDCRHPETGVAEAPADAIIARLDSYTEVSPSGTGYHVLVEGELPGDRNRRGEVELYDRARYFTVTGARVDGTPAAIHARQDALAWLSDEYLQPGDADVGSAVDVASGDSGATPEQAPLATGGNDLSDDAVLERARDAANGDKFQRLWRGHTAGYPSHSEADMALCCLLAFWTGGDTQQVDRLFRDSGLMRDKWDEVHYADGSTYGEKTIERAIANTSEFYDPSAGDDAAADRTTSGAAPTAVGRADPDRSHTYLAEKTRLLTARVTELEATLARKNERIDALEAEIEGLEKALATGARQPRDSHDAHTDDAAADDDEAEEVSVWARTKRWFGGSVEIIQL